MGVRFFGLGKGGGGLGFELVGGGEVKMFGGMEGKRMNGIVGEGVS